MAVQGTVTLTFQGSDQRPVGLSGNGNLPINYAATCQFHDGTDALGVKMLWQPPRTLSGATDTLNFKTGLVDSYGSPIVASSIVGILIHNTGTANLVVGAAGANTWATWLNATGTFTLPPGGWTGGATPDAIGWAVGASSNTLLITGTSGQTYNIAVFCK